MIQSVHSSTDMGKVDYSNKVGREPKQNVEVKDTNSLSRIRDGVQPKAVPLNEQEKPFVGVNEEERNKFLEEVNQKLEISGKKLQYSIHEKTQRILIKVVDSETEEVIKEVPEEKLIDMMADLCEAAGLLVDERI